MRILRKLRSLFRKKKLDRDMDAEMRTHVEMQTERNIAAGMDADEARYAALRQFGNVASLQERAREQRGWVWLEQLVRDFRFALRMLAKSPGYTCVIIASLALGIGANTVVFSWIQWAILNPLPAVSRAGQLHVIEPRDAGGTYVGSSWREYLDLREHTHTFADITAFRFRRPLSLGEPGSDERAWAMFVSGNYFSFLGLHAAQGRFFRPDEVSQPGGAPVAVVSHLFWRNRLGGAPDVIGRTLRLNDRVLTIVGIAPEDFQGTFSGLAFDLWVPATMITELMPDLRELERRDARGFYLMGRLAAGVTPAQAQADLDAAMGDLAASYPDTNRNLAADLRPLWRAPRTAQTLLAGAFGTLQAIVLLVLLVVCTNTAHLLLARATVRRREIAIRLAIGASRVCIVRQLLTESLVLALAGGVFGVLLALWGIDMLRAIPMPGDLPLRIDPHLDPGSLLYSLGLGVACGLVFGLAPALQLARSDVGEALKAGARDTGSRGFKVLRDLLVGLEVALALVVLVVTGIFLKSFSNARTLDPGFRAPGILLAAYDLTARGYDAKTGPAFLAELLTRVRARPEVESAAVAAAVPINIGGLPSTTFEIEGRPDEPGRPDRALFYQVTPGYFATMGIPFTAGTDLTDLADLTRQPELVINDEAARRFWPGESPLGRRVNIPGVSQNAWQVVGIVRTSRAESLTERPKPLFYFSFRDRFWFAGAIHVRVRAGDPLAFLPALRAVVRELDPNLPLADARTLAQHLENQAFMRRTPVRMLSVLGPLALALAAIGIYSVLAYAVAQRTQEIGVRLALGATPRGIVCMVMREGLRVVVASALVGWLLAFAIGWFLSRRIGNVALGDPLIYLGVPALLLAVAGFACWLPARKASHVDPLCALRAE